ncbi:abortive infection system antitoxin AbiGi family protein [Hydrogenophaga crocea]|uniref:Uncharacterized protein n=1 Tax=Hydrogenophaga crocea TaxID=2716225 RepID=A0A6G8IH90_9BURK|nr:abortive infection system antitoxin AbiGi family protein [Hydrogenophaga crocea]QIM52513.1 hypothetical protein G9Q37_10340 [Hydrogenophaga crocea]
MLPTLRFLHSMRELEFLRLALSEGLMFTDHEAAYVPASSTAEWEELSAGVTVLLKQRLAALGKPWQSLSEGRRETLMSGIGSMRGKIPMICFTEIPEGRQLWFQQFTFGRYGVVVSRSWLERNGGDRVLYVGENSELSRRLYRVIATFMASTVLLGQDGEPVFSHHSFPPILDLLACMEQRSNLAELEWRIPGHHGFHSGQRATGRRLPLPLGDVEAVLVKEASEVAEVERLMRTLPGSNSLPSLPLVIHQPAVL